MLFLLSWVVVPEGVGLVAIDSVGLRRVDHPIHVQGIPIHQFQALKWLRYGEVGCE